MEQILIVIMTVVAIAYPFKGQVASDEEPELVLNTDPDHDYRLSRGKQYAIIAFFVAMIFSGYLAFRKNQFDIAFALGLAFLLLWLPIYLLSPIAVKLYLIPISRICVIFLSALYTLWGLATLISAAINLKIGVVFGVDRTPLPFSLDKDPLFFWIFVSTNAALVAACIRILRGWIVLRYRNSAANIDHGRLLERAPVTRKVNSDMSIPTETYETIHSQYLAAMRWMTELGIQLTSGRTTHYENVIRNWKDVYKTATKEEGRKVFPDFVSSMFEVFDFVSIHKAFGGMPRERLTSIVRKLQKGVNGPINMVDETPDSTAARNFLFEVSVAAKAHRPDKGVEAILDARSDTGIRISSKKLWVECKRVTTIDKIERNVRKASKQLESVLSNEVGAGHRGIVALDVSKILNRGGEIFVTPNDNELVASVDHLMDQFIKEYAHIWQNIYQTRQKKVIGTIIRFSFMASSEARNLLVHASQWAMNPRVGISTNDEHIQRQLVAMLADTR